eukprot:scaffold31525_cov46-Prasinocladus_malaysianus.AAC.1
MRGLPYSSTVADVAEFFDGVALSAGLDSILLTSTQDGRPTGEAYVEFADDVALKEAMKRHKNSIGNRYIELFSSTKGDMLQAGRHSNYHAGYTESKPVHTKRGSYAAAAAQVPNTGPAAE